MSAMVWAAQVSISLKSISKVSAKNKLALFSYRGHLISAIEKS